MVLYEAKICQLIKGGKEGITLVGIPKVHWWGTEGSYNVFVMELLGESIEQLFLKAGKKFSLKTVVMLADQMVTPRATGSSKGLSTCTTEPSFTAMSKPATS